MFCMNQQTKLPEVQHKLQLLGVTGPLHLAWVAVFASGNANDHAHQGTSV